MPGFDGRGPMWGGGPGAGWGRGPCGAGMGWRRGRGWGRGWFGRFWGQPQVTPKEERGILEDEAKNLEAELKEVREEIARLKTNKK